MSELPGFRNEPILELRRAPVRAGLSDALASLEARLPLEVPVLIGGEAATAGQELLSRDPGMPDRVVARCAAAGPADVDRAVATAAGAYGDWSARPAIERARALVGAAAWMRERRVELAALAVRECAKPWTEADADVCEAIDFLEYYARQAVDLERPRPLMQVEGERNEMRYVGRGVAAVISPWNFPLAIACGMTAGALAAGNTVLFKPAEQSPGCGLMVVRALLAGGVPAGALSLLPGEGDVGAALVRHPAVHTIAFTGSQAVGLEIVRAAAEPAPGQKHIKRVVAELGGKNCVIVAADADLDEAVPAIIYSAFAYAGQKCSAAARVLAAREIAEPLRERLAGAARVLVVGQADALETQVPPLIEADAQARLRSCGEQAERQGRVVVGGGPVPDSGWFVPPVVVSDLPAGSELLHTEIFGPLLSVETVRDVEEACDRVDELPFALTGGLFSRNPATVRYVRGRTPVGNLYVNRGITGAIVGRHPFGGNRLSGTGSKAGGPDYLLQFVEPRAVSENTMRHGLAV
ncbi:MAG TPA: aldehyde dehydrogenase family protein [Solirubrobacteraceae bacterium]|nr:aldehyde dehydrogenase family protein [Solirubrobacteraceae bacterium]